MLRRSVLAILTPLLLTAPAFAAAETGVRVTPPYKPPVPAHLGVAATAALPALPAAAGAAGAQLGLEAVVAEGAALLQSPVLWTVSRKAATPGQPEEVVAQQQAAMPQFALAPGAYQVSAQFGDAVVRQEIVVPAGASRHRVNLNVGYVSMDMIPHAGAGKVKDPVVWEVYRYAPGDVQENRKVTVATAPSKQFVLPAGHYVVRALYEGTATDLVVPVGAGTDFRYTINLYAGKAVMKPIDYGSNKPINKDVTWEIYRAKPEADGSRDLVMSGTTRRDHIFLLREGLYLVRAEADGLVGERTFAVRAGKNERVDVVLGGPAPQPASAAVQPPAAAPAAVPAMLLVPPQKPLPQTTTISG